MVKVIYISVKNLNGTSGERYVKSSQIEEYRKYTKHLQGILKCSHLGCSNTTINTTQKKGSINGQIVGAHVIKREDDKSWYIIPLCSACNQIKDKFFEVKIGTEFMPLKKENEIKTSNSIPYLPSIVNLKELVKISDAKIKKKLYYP